MLLQRDSIISSLEEALEQMSLHLETLRRESMTREKKIYRLESEKTDCSSISKRADVLQQMMVDAICDRDLALDEAANCREASKKLEIRLLEITRSKSTCDECVQPMQDRRQLRTTVESFKDGKSLRDLIARSGKERHKLLALLASNDRALRKESRVSMRLKKQNAKLQNDLRRMCLLRSMTQQNSALGSISATTPDSGSSQNDPTIPAQEPELKLKLSPRLKNSRQTQLDRPVRVQGSTNSVECVQTGAIHDVSEESDRNVKDISSCEPGTFRERSPEPELTRKLASPIITDAIATELPSESFSKMQATLPGSKDQYESMDKTGKTVASDCCEAHCEQTELNVTDDVDETRKCPCPKHHDNTPCNTSKPRRCGQLHAQQTGTMDAGEIDISNMRIFLNEKVKQFQLEYHHQFEREDDQDLRMGGLLTTAKSIILFLERKNIAMEALFHEALSPTNHEGRERIQKKATIPALLAAQKSETTQCRDLPSTHAVMYNSAERTAGGKEGSLGDCNIPEKILAKITSNSVIPAIAPLMREHEQEPEYLQPSHDSLPNVSSQIARSGLPYSVNLSQNENSSDVQSLQQIQTEARRICASFLENTAQGMTDSAATIDDCCAPRCNSTKASQIAKSDDDHLLGQNPTAALLKNNDKLKELLQQIKTRLGHHNAGTESEAPELRAATSSDLRHLSKSVTLPDLCRKEDEPSLFHRGKYSVQRALQESHEIRGCQTSGQMHSVSCSEGGSNCHETRLGAGDWNGNSMAVSSNCQGPSVVANDRSSPVCSELHSCLGSECFEQEHTHNNHGSQAKVSECTFEEENCRTGNGILNAEGNRRSAASSRAHCHVARQNEQEENIRVCHPESFGWKRTQSRRCPSNAVDGALCPEEQGPGDEAPDLFPPQTEICHIEGQTVITVDRKTRLICKKVLSGKRKFRENDAAAAKARRLIMARILQKTQAQLDEHKSVTEKAENTLRELTYLVQLRTHDQTYETGNFCGPSFRNQGDKNDRESLASSALRSANSHQGLNQSQTRGTEKHSAEVDDAVFSSASCSLGLPRERAKKNLFLERFEVESETPRIPGRQYFDRAVAHACNIQLADLLNAASNLERTSDLIQTLLQSSESICDSKAPVDEREAGVTKTLVARSRVTDEHRKAANSAEILAETLHAEYKTDAPSATFANVPGNNQEIQTPITRLSIFLDSWSRAQHVEENPRERRDSEFCSATAPSDNQAYELNANNFEPGSKEVLSLIGCLESAVAAIQHSIRNTHFGAWRLQSQYSFVVSENENLKEGNRELKQMLEGQCNNYLHLRRTMTDIVMFLSDTVPELKDDVTRVVGIENGFAFLMDAMLLTDGAARIVERDLRDNRAALQVANLKIEELQRTNDQLRQDYSRISENMNVQHAYLESRKEERDLLRDEMKRKEDSLSLLKLDNSKLLQELESRKNQLELKNMELQRARDRLLDRTDCTIVGAGMSVNAETEKLQPSRAGELPQEGEHSNASSKSENGLLKQHVRRLQREFEAIVVYMEDFETSYPTPLRDDLTFMSIQIDIEERYTGRDRSCPRKPIVRTKDRNFDGRELDDLCIADREQSHAFSELARKAQVCLASLIERCVLAESKWRALMADANAAFLNVEKANANLRRVLSGQDQRNSFCATYDDVFHSSSQEEQVRIQQRILVANALDECEQDLRKLQETVLELSSDKEDAIFRSSVQETNYEKKRNIALKEIGESLCQVTS